MSGDNGNGINPGDAQAVAVGSSRFGDGQTPQENYQVNTAGTRGQEPDPFQTVPGSNQGFDRSNVVQEQTVSSLDDKVTQSQVESKAEEQEAAEVLRELSEKFQLNLNADPKAKKGIQSLTNWIDLADRLTPYLFQPPVNDKMSPQEQAKYKGRIARKIAIYDTIKKVTGITKFTEINLYKHDASRFLKKLHKVRSKIEKDLEIFRSELKGYSGNAVDNEFFKEVLDTLPQHVKGQDKYRSLVEVITKGSGVQTGDGLKDKLRDYQAESRWLADVDDILLGSILSFDTKLEGLQTEIRDITKKLGDSPRDETLMKQRAEKNAMYTTYERERDKLVDNRDDVLNRMNAVEVDFQSLENQVSLREVAVAKSAKTLTRLNGAIKTVENYIHQRKDMVVVTDHILLVDQAYGLIGQAEGVATIFGAFTNVGYKQLRIAEEKLGETPYARSNASNAQLRDSMRTQRDEQAAALKTRIRSRMYKP